MSTRCDVASLFDAEEYLYFMASTLRDEDTRAQCSFVESALALAPGSRVLDLGCGHGRHANELARRGHRPLGVDLVEGFIAIARDEAARESLPTQFACADLRAFDGRSDFDAAICLFDAFGYDDDAEQARILDGCRAALRPHGRLLLDVRTREFMLRSAPVSLVEMDNGDLMIDRFQFDVEAGRLIDRRTCLRGVHRRDIVFSVRLYTCTELRSLLQACGFRVDAFYGGYDGAPLSTTRPRTLVVATRAETPFDAAG